MQGILLAATVAIAAAGPVGAESISGNYLLSACTTQDPTTQGFCVGYIIGAIEGMRFGLAYPFMSDGQTSASEINEMSNTLLMNCPPEGVENGQYADVVVQYLKSRPEIRHGSARIMILAALQEAFPCPN